MSSPEHAPEGIDPTVPNVARMYDFYLRGKTNFPADRLAAERLMAAVPGVRETTLANREFLGRAVTVMAEAGVRQFLDIGTGLPTQENVHEVALRAAPDSRVVYVDNDPVVLVHARALLADNPQTIAVRGDLVDPGAIVADPAVRAHLDFSRPVAVLLMAVLHFIPGHDQTAAIVATLRERMAPGSHLALSHFYSPDAGQATVRAGGRIYAASSSGSLTSRTYRQIEGYFTGLDLLDPGLVPVHAWRPHDHDSRYFKDADAAAIDLARPGLLGAVARKI